MKPRLIIVTVLVAIGVIALFQRESIRRFMVSGNNGLSGIARVEVCDIQVNVPDGQPVANILCKGDYATTVVDHYTIRHFTASLSPIDSSPASPPESGRFILHYPLAAVPRFYQSVKITIENSATKEKSDLNVLLWANPRGILLPVRNVGQK